MFWVHFRDALIKMWALMLPFVVVAVSAALAPETTTEIFAAFSVVCGLASLAWVGFKFSNWLDAHWE